MRLPALLFVAVLLVGCAPETHDGVAVKAEQTKEIVDGVRAAIGSDIGKAVAATVATLPVPGAQAVPVAREGVEWGLGLLSGGLALVAAWQRKRASEEAYKKKIYKDNSSQAELNAANKVIYGDQFDPKLSKF